MSFQGHPRHAIVGIDGTRRCEGAVRAALELNRKFGTTFEVLHTIDLPSQEWIHGRPDKVGEMEASIEARTYEALADDLAGLARDQAEGVLLREALRVGIGKPGPVAHQPCPREPGGPRRDRPARKEGPDGLR